MTYYISCQPGIDVALCEDLMQHYAFEYSNTQLPRLELQKQGLVLLTDAYDSFIVDWNQVKWMQRAKGGRGSDPLVKVSLAAQGAVILDLTAGWGRDALVMAHAGAKLVMLEQHPYLAALLHQAHTRLENINTKNLMTVVWAEAKQYLNTLALNVYPDVIYYDPMHPSRSKTALVKKDLQVLQQLVGPNTDVLESIELARQRCLKRVVVKWPEKQPPVIAPDFSIHGKTIRFDVYFPNRDSIENLDSSGSR